MLSFKQFVTESLWDSVTSFNEYAEIYKNPTTSEIAKLAAEHLKNKRAIGAMLDLPGVPTNRLAELAAFSTPSDVYVWDRDKAEHSVIKSLLKQKGIAITDDTFPMYFQVNPGKPSVLNARFAAWTASTPQVTAFRDIGLQGLASRPPLTSFTIRQAAF